MNEETIQRIARTILVVWGYCIIWQILELYFYCEIQNRIVDNIMMVLFIPMIWRGVKE